MLCQKCGQSNPDDHRFCGMCGARLEPAMRSVDERWQKTVGIDEEDPLELASSEVPAYASSAKVKIGDRERKALRDSSASNPVDYGRAARSLRATVNSLPPDTAEEEAEEETQSRHEQPTGSGDIGGPSFLGLNYSEPGSNSGFVYDAPRRDGFVYDTDGESPEYLLEEQTRRSSWRAWALFLLLAVAGALAYIQWRSSHHEGPDLATILSRNGATVPASGAVQPEKTSAPSTSSSTSTDNTAAPASSQSGTQANSQQTPADNPAQPPDAKLTGNPATSEDKTADQGAKKPETKADSGSTASVSSASVAKADSAPATSSVDNADEDAATPESDHDTDTTDAPKSKAATSQPRENEDRASASELPKTLGDRDPLVIKAENYLQGRGVRQNCSTAVNLLRQAVSAGNPAANVKMGALYWTGTCVAQSKVTAYLWFTRAQDLEPNNRWIARSKRSLWASMTSAERQRVGY